MTHYDLEEYYPIFTKDSDLLRTKCLNSSLRTEEPMSLSEITYGYPRNKNPLPKLPINSNMTNNPFKLKESSRHSFLYDSVDDPKNYYNFNLKIDSYDHLKQRHVNPQSRASHMSTESHDHMLWEDLVPLKAYNKKGRASSLQRSRENSLGNNNLKPIFNSPIKGAGYTIEGLYGSTERSEEFQSLPSNIKLRQSSCDYKEKQILPSNRDKARIKTENSKENLFEEIFALMKGSPLPMYYLFQFILTK